MAGPKLKYQATPSDVNKCTRLEREVFEQGFSPLSITVLLSPGFTLIYAAVHFITTLFYTNLISS